MMPSQLAPLDPPAIAGLLEASASIVEAERRGFAGRIRTLLAEESPSFEGWDQPSVAAVRHDCGRDPSELLAEFLWLRQESVELVRSLRPDDLVRNGRHAVVGWLTVGDVLAEWVHHDRNHIRQILANTQARVWDQMGNARRFSDPTA